MHRFIVRAVLALALLALAATAALAQNAPRRTLFDVLFGGNQQQEQVQTAPQPRPQPQQSAPRPQPQPQTAARPAPSAPPPPPTVEKAPNAKRIAVMGDSLAVDLARALERLYAEDPGVVVIDMGVGSSGFVREDYYNWNVAAREAVAESSFDVAVVAIGINDRQEIGTHAALSDEWRAQYQARVERFLSTLRGKQVIWIELPPMERASYGAAMQQISAIHKAAVFAAGGEWIETFERYMSEAGGYTTTGPDLNGNIVAMRKSDGIHFSSAGADKLAFYVDRAVGARPGIGGSTMEVADLLAGTDAASMLRPPFQGLGQMRLFEMAGTVQQITGARPRASELVVTGAMASRVEPFDIEAMLNAPAGRVDTFGVPPPLVVENPRGR